MKLTEAQVERVRSLEDDGGRVSALVVLEDAQDKASPLHELFDWNNKTAAHQHRLHQAREIIGAVTVQITHHNRTLDTPAYVNLPGADGRGYQRTDAVREDPEQATRSMIFTLDVAAGHLRRAFDLAGPLGLEDEIDKLLAEVVHVKQIAAKKKAA